MTSDGTIVVADLEPGATFEYSTDGGVNWTPGTGTSFELGEGVYADVQVRQIDLAGNVSTATSLGPIEIAFPVAVDDAATLDMGDPTSTTQPPVTDTAVTVVGLTESDIGADNSLTVSVSPDTTGSVRIEISQTALVAVADAFRLDIVDADGNVVYSAVTEDSLLGDVAGLELLGLTSDNTLVAIVEGLPPGDYQVVVRNDAGELEGLLDTNGDGITLAELGDAGVVLGPDNQTLVLDTVEDALGGGVLGSTVRDLLETALDLSTDLGAGDLVDILSDILETVGATELLDTVVDAVADNLLSNTLTVLQSTSITATVTEYDFANETLTGNVIGGGADAGADDVGGGATVTQVTNAEGTVVTVPDGGTATIAGAYGVLVIAADGSYTYTANGDPASVGESEVFTYTLGDGVTSDTATLTIALEGTAVDVADDTATAEVEFANVVDDGYFDGGGTLQGAVLGENEYIGSSFVIEDNMAVSGTVSVDATVALLSSGTLFLEEEVAPGSWVTVEERDYTVLLNALGEVVTLDLGPLNLDEGTYRVRSTLGGALSVVSITTDVDVTYLDQFTVDGTTPATGNLLDNDEAGSLLTELQVFDPDTSSYVEVEAGTAATVDGTYGTLTLDADGSYTYTLLPQVPYFDEPQVETFSYQLVHPTGEIAQGTLEVTVEPSGAGVPVPLAATTLAFDFDTIPIESLELRVEDRAEARATGYFEYDLFEGQGTLEDVLEGYLDSREAPLDAEVGSTSPDEGTDIAAVAPVEDPLGYLTLNPDLSPDDQWNNHSVI
ncbi:BapA/Bap/LapF family large adhesin [Novosphingobium soli]|uniref:BapA/Bap/LapF family large adhesin n=1 Tax=Novosphingobium soli TaxID=574956 RepID=A0ABV6CSI1_9SPHN